MLRHLEGGSQPRRVHLEVGTVSKAIDAFRDARAASNDAGGAILALARSGDPRAREAVGAWFRSAPEEVSGEVAGLLFEAGFGMAADGTLARTHSVAAYQLRPVAPQKKGLLSSVRRVLGKGKESATTGATGTMWGTGRASCGACRAPLLRVLSISTARVPDVLPEGVADEISVWTCRNCVAVDHSPYYVRLGAMPESIFREAPARDFEPAVRHTPVSPEPVEVTAVPAPSRVQFMFAAGDELTRVGGAPSWVQGAEAVACPTCTAVMPFLCQFADPQDDLWGGDTGMLFAFLCSSCRVVGTVVQCS
jgi:hypothetical protein